MLCGVLAALVGVGAGRATAAVRCEYLKPAEIRRVLGVAAVTRATSPDAPDDVTRCDFDVGTAADSSVHVWVQDGDDAAAGFRAADRVFAADAEDVEGFGKRAFYVGEGFNVLYVLRRGTLVYVQHPTPSDDAAATKAAVEELTGIVLGRI